MPARVLPEPRRGEVWLATLDKRRPVVVLTRDPMGRYLHAVLVAPVTSTVRGISTEVPLTKADGLPKACVANVDNAQLLARSSFVRRLGNVRPPTMRNLCTAVAIATGCD